MLLVVVEESLDGIVGLYCDSSWELAFVVFCLEHGIEICRCVERFPYVFEGKTHTYLPDFIIDGKYVEIKGFSTPQWESKKEQFPYDLLVITGLEITTYIDYVKDKYGNDFTSLYSLECP